MVDIVSRSEWGARAPRHRQTVSWSQRVEVTLHYSLGPTSQTPRQIQDYHMDRRGWSDGGYNFLVDDDGTAYEMRGWTVVGAHAAPRNVEGIGICYIGRDGMSDAAKATVVALYDEACRRAGRTLRRRCHRDINSTSCPGDDNCTWWKSSSYRDVAGGSISGEDPLIGLSKGDSGEQVKALQALIGYAGGELPRYGVDGDYGDETAAGLLAVRASVGSAAEPGWGDQVTGYAYAQLLRAVARAEAQR